MQAIGQSKLNRSQGDPGKIGYVGHINELHMIKLMILARENGRIQDIERTE